MRDIWAWLLCAALVTVGAAGCGGKQTYTSPEGETVTVDRGGGGRMTVETEEGTVEVDTEGGRASFKGKEGSAEMEFGADIAPEEVGFPLYPGATVVHTGRYSQTGEEAGKVSQVQLRTPDSVGEVKAFYEDAVPDAKTAMEATSDELSICHLVYGDKEDGVQKAVMISREASEDQTTIMLTRMQEGE